MEAAFQRIPVVINNPPNIYCEEIINAGFLLVEDTASGYAKGIRRVIAETDTRAGIVESAHKYALSEWNQEVIEGRIIGVYEKVGVLK
jgi:glycosyltransferase involved in cell wall biosynthesis